MRRVLVTGGSGFIGSHAILELLRTGHKVRTTVRTPSREPDVRAMLAVGGIDSADNLDFVEADLTRDEGWEAAVADCDFVLHVASPFPASLPDHEDDLIIPARDGALRVLRASRDAGVRRVVLTSSFAAVGYGHPPQEAPFDETVWTRLDGRAVTPYTKSKTIAERAAWDFIEGDASGMELSVVNPVAVFGPVLGADHSTSTTLVQRLMDGTMPAVPDLSFGAVDVRDVVDLHLRAMTHPAAAGERFLAVAEDRAVSLKEMADILRREMGSAAHRVPTRQLPSWLVRLLGIFRPDLRSVAPELGRRKHSTSAKARKLLGWEARSVEAALVATAESLIELGLLSPEK